MLLSLKENQRLVDFLNLKGSYGKILFIFDHGLGDLINFLPIVEELKYRYPNFRFDVGSPKKRGLQGLFNIVIINKCIKEYFRLYTYIYIVKYLEPSSNEKFDGISKPYLCNIKTIGMENFVWKPYKSNIELKNKDSKKVGIHFTGNTGKKFKDVPFDRIEVIWEEIENCGYEPFEIYMNSFNCFDLNFPGFITTRNSLRFEKQNILKMVDTITRCKYFVGIDSGPFYLAGSILGLDNCVGLERFLKFNWYLPYEINKVNVSFYKTGDLTKIIKEKDNEKC